MKVLEVLSVKRFKCGYEVRTEIWDAGCGDEAQMEMKAAYTPDGDYIGTPQDAHTLVFEKGIQPQKSLECHSVCSIGYSVKDGKWYGWSHRAFCGFKVGSKCSKGSCHYRPRNRKEFREDMKLFWSDKDHLNIKSRCETQDGMKGVYTYWTYSDTIPNEALRGSISGVFDAYPEEWGKGEWVAKTTADAKQMAIDFAEGVS